MAEEKYSPMDMSNYPYSVNDVLAEEIKIVKIVKGTINDSQKGLLARKFKGHDENGQEVYGEPQIVRDPIDAMDKQQYRGRMKVIGIAADPDAQMVFYQLFSDKPNLDGSRRIYSMRPDAFLEFAKAAQDKLNPPMAPTAPDVVNETTLSDWTPEEDKFIQDNYLTMTDAEMAEHLNVEVKSLTAHRLDDLQLKKTGTN